VSSTGDGLVAVDHFGIAQRVNAQHRIDCEHTVVPLVEAVATVPPAVRGSRVHPAVESEKETFMGWFKKHTLGDPTAVARYRQALRERANHRPSIVTPDEVFWKLDMRVFELQKTVPFVRRLTLSPTS
jgi:hypothetical protein